MSDNIVEFKLPDGEEFKRIVESHMVVIFNIFHKCLGYKVVVIEKISFVDYQNKGFHRRFPFNKKLTIMNTSQSLKQFGFGNFSGAFFEVIAKVDLGASGTPINFRIFYEEEQSLDTVQASGESDKTPESKCEGEGEKQDTMYILGADRPFIKRGRATYVSYNGTYISLTEAKKLERANAQKVK